jgi:branched-chain amino acid transport system ATP-binding protein
MLEVVDLHAYYGKSHVLHGVNLHVNAGEIVCLLGRNGVGRSTTAKAVMGQVVAKGSVRFKGRDILGMKAYEIARLGIGLVPENRDDLSRPEREAEPDAGRQGHPRHRALEHRRHVRVVPAPQGTRRHARRRALRRRAADADPVPHADGRPGPDHDRRTHRGPGAEDRRAGRQFLQEVRKRGISILLIEQKLAIALDISERLYLMGHGRIVFEGTPADLKNNEAIRKEWLEV